MPRQFFSGNSIEQAVMSAARHYQIDPERLAYKVRDKKHGFLNIRRRVVIEVDPENLEVSAQTPPVEPAVEPVEPAVEPVEPDDPREQMAQAMDSEEDSPDFGDEVDSEDEAQETDEDVEDPDDDDQSAADDDDDQADDAEEPSGRDDRGRGGRGRGGRGRGRGHGDRKNQRRRDVTLKEFSWKDGEDGWDPDEVEEGESPELAAIELCVERILDVMDMEIEYTITEGEAMDLEFSGEDAEFLIEDNGKVLKAIEHIVPRMVRGLIGRSIAVNADCEGFRADHEDALKSAAEDAAREVVRQGKPKTLNPMNPADRRIVHLALVDHPQVNTVSQGHGFMKRVKIVPSDS